VGEKVRLEKCKAALAPDVLSQSLGRGAQSLLNDCILIPSMDIGEYPEIHK